MRRVVHYNTERIAERARKKFKKYASTKKWRWVVQGNSLVKILKRK